MIINIMGEGLFDLRDEHIAALNALDGELEAEVEAGDRGRFDETLEQMRAFVRQRGNRLEYAGTQHAEAVLPARDTPGDELRRLLQDEGLIPGR